MKSFVYIILLLSVLILISSSYAAVIKDNSIAETDSGKYERTFILLKPDAVQRGLIGKVIERFETKGFKLVAMKFMTPTKELIENHYKQLKSREFYSRMLRQIVSGPVIPMVWEGLNAVQIGRKMMGASGTLDSSPGTIRSDFSIDVQRNVIHGSHSVEAAEYEINLWFDKSELNSWTPGNTRALYE